LQANPAQLEGAAAFFAGFPTVRVIVNHVGCLRLNRGEEADAAAIAVWRRGMAALAALPHVYVKISMLTFVHEVRNIMVSRQPCLPVVTRPICVPPTLYPRRAGRATRLLRRG